MGENIKRQTRIHPVPSNISATLQLFWFCSHVTVCFPDLLQVFPNFLLVETWETIKAS